LSCERTLAGDVGVGGAVHVGLSLCSEMLRRGHGLAAVPVLNKGTISICHGKWVCAILGDGGVWHHLCGITRRKTSVTL
jgi:hypothetical protein